MPVTAILQEPGKAWPLNTIHAAYRPIYFKVRATSNGVLTAANFIPPIVYCDIYFNDIFYKTLSKTQYINKPDYASSIYPEYEFDIADPCREYLSSLIPANGDSSILPMLEAHVNCSCKFRASSINASGFIEPEPTAPIQGTGNKPPSSGSGLLSFPFYVVNASLQHEHNQDLATHLSYSKRGLAYSTDTYPLTHRSLRYILCKDNSDYFPFIHFYGSGLAKICLNYKKKGETSFTKLCVTNSCPTIKNIKIVSIVRNADLTTQTITFNWDPLPPIVTNVYIAYREQGSMGGWPTIPGSPVGPRSITIPLGLYEVMLATTGSCLNNWTTPMENVGLLGLPTLTEISNEVIYIGLFTRIRREVFQVGKYVNPNNRFQLIVYAITVEIKAVAGDTPITIAQKLAAKVNATSYPITRAPYKITATPINDTIKIELDYQHQFAGAAYET